VVNRRQILPGMTAAQEENNSKHSNITIDIGIDQIDCEPCNRSIADDISQSFGYLIHGTCCLSIIAFVHFN